ncbi:hypothetical protein ABLB84_17020 [Xenorhabdus szentirmaii]|uniref:hypothetical protein n=1 Tax=Xenorhabdus szentirmaii TaxID=290112 RepID=UPI0032B84958
MYVIGKNNLLTDHKGLSISVPDGTDVIIGQQFLLDVIKASDIELPSNYNIELNDLYGRTMDTSYSGSPSLSSDKKIYKKNFLLTIDDSIPGGSTASYKISADSDSIPISYIGRELDLSSVKIKVDKRFIAMPYNTDPIGRDTKYVRFSEKLIDKSGKVIKNTPVMIVSSPQGGIEMAKFTTDPEDGFELPTIINPVKINDDKVFIMLHADENGEISFRLYPLESLSGAIQLLNKIGRVAIPGEETHIVDPFNTDYLLPAVIPDLDHIILTDFIKNEDDVNSYYLNFNKFLVGTPSHLYYMIVRIGGDFEYSQPKEFTCYWSELLD